VYLVVFSDDIPEESDVGLPLQGSRSVTSSFSIKTFLPRRRARAPESPPSSDELEDIGELVRVLVAELWWALPLVGEKHKRVAWEGCELGDVASIVLNLR
jgi:hypothetical protein